MTKSISKSVFAAALMAGLLFTSVAPTAFAQPQYRTRDRNVRTTNYDRGRDYDYQRDRDYDRRARNRSYDYENDPYYDYDRNRTKKDALKRTGVGAAIGAAGGGLMGGRKGALIGGLIGAAGGYIYHRKKENDRRY